MDAIWAAPIDPLWALCAFLTFLLLAILWIAHYDPY